MSKADYEAHVVVIGRRKGVRYADRRQLQVPADVATGNFERLSELQLRELRHDIDAEYQRRSDAASKQRAIAAELGGFDPLSTQKRG